MDYERFIFWFLESPITAWHAYKKKTLPLSYNMHLFFTLLAQWLPKRFAQWYIFSESSFKYLGVNISEDLTWTAHIQTQVKKARQRLTIATAEEIQGLTSYPENFLFRGHRNNDWLSSSQCGMETSPSGHKALQRVVRIAWAHLSVCSPLSAGHLPQTLQSRAAKIIKDSNHPCNRLFNLLPSGKRFRSMMAKLRGLGWASSPRPSGS